MNFITILVIIFKISRVFNASDQRRTVMAKLFRKRLIPNECIELKNDSILAIDKEKIITRWETFRPKAQFTNGISYYVLEKGFKISKFLKSDNSLAYIYCDIINTDYDPNSDTYVFTDLLADVIIENSGLIRVVDLDELADACKEKLITNDMLVSSLYKLDNLLSCIYDGSFKKYIDVLDTFMA